MNIIFELYYAVFAIFASLLLTEVISALMLIFFWKQSKSKVIEYISPIWEVTGTFGAFWVVIGYFAYPSLLIPVASIFAPLLIVFLILFVARSASLVFAGYTTNKKWLDETKLYKSYAISTLILGLTVLIFLSALISGAGVNLSDFTFSVGDWIVSPGSLLFIIGTLFIGIGVAPVFFAIDSMKKFVLPLTVLGVGISVLAYYLYSSSFISIFMAIPAVLTLLVGILFVASKKTAGIVSNKAVFIAVLSIIIFSLQFLVYPSAVGGAINVDLVTISGPLTSAYIGITIVGGAILAIMLGFYMRIAKRSKYSTQKEESQ